MLRRTLTDFSVAVVLLLAGGLVILIPMIYRGFSAREFVISSTLKPFPAHLSRRLKEALMIRQSHQAGRYTRPFLMVTLLFAFFLAAVTNTLADAGIPDTSAGHTLQGISGRIQ